MKPTSNLALTLAIAAATAFIAGCATESHKTIKPETSVAARIQYLGPKRLVAIGKLSNESSYMRGIFSDGVDRLGGQAATILASHLQQSGRFTVLERTNLDQLAKEAQLQDSEQKLQGANFILTGQVTEFGRKEVGDQQLYGVLGSGKKQIAYAKVTINVVDVGTSQIVYSVQGAGEYALSSREVVGFGGSSSYDSTLNGKVLDLAIREAVDRLAEGVESNSWPLKAN